MAPRRTLRTLALVATALSGAALVEAVPQRPAPSLQGACQGSFPFQGAGSAFFAGGGGSLSGQSLTLKHNAGYSIMSQCHDDWQPYDFYALKLIGKTISFDVDLSGAGCGCNVAFYLIFLPGKDESGVPSQGTCPYSPYYCDANQVCGQWCPEMDIMEANNRAFQMTPHKCDQPSDKGHYTHCDGGGEGQNTRHLGGNAYGPGSSFTIDTTRAFSVSTTFAGTALQGVNATGALTSVRTVLSQDGRSVELHNDDANYLSGLAWALTSGMSLRITYWGSTMQWLDGCDQSQTCSAGDVTLSNFRVGSAEDLVVV